MRATAILVLSYRIDCGTRPKKPKAAVWQVHGEEVDLLFHPANHRHGFAEVRLRMPGIVPERYEHFPQPLAARLHVVLHDGETAGIAVLVAQPLEDPLRRMPLLRRPALI